MTEEITQLKQQNIELRSNFSKLQQRFQKTLVGLPFSCVSITREGSIKSINEKFSKLTGYTGADISDKNLNKLIQDAEGIPCDKLLESTSDEFFSAKIKDKSGSIVPVLITSGIELDGLYMVFMLDYGTVKEL